MGARNRWPAAGTDRLLVEPSELTSGSTRHAAGVTAALAATATMTWLHKDSFELYPKLEHAAVPGQGTGSTTVADVACDPVRHRRVMSMVLIEQHDKHIHVQQRSHNVMRPTRREHERK